jgi:hypothetical protein
MGLIQTGSTLMLVEGQGLVGVGPMELWYGCDSCEAATGDPYAHIAMVVIARDGEVVDASEVEGWEFFHDEPEGSGCTRSYCADCAHRRHEGAETT